MSKQMSPTAAEAATANAGFCVGRGGRGADRARRGPLVRRLRRGVRPALPGSSSTPGRSSSSTDAKRPNSYLGALRPRRRRPGRGPHLHLLRAEDDAGPTNNWRDPAEMRETLDGLFRGCDAGPHDVRGAVLHGPARLADRPHRRRAHRLAPTSRCQHADHDPHGQGRPRRARRRWRVRALPALGGHAARTGRRRGRAVAVQRRQQVHRALPRDARDLVVRLGLRRQRAARQEVLRAADRLGDGARRGLDGRAHADPQAHLARGRGQVHHRRVPVGVRQDQPGDARPHARRAGRSRRSATTSPG